MNVRHTPLLSWECERIADAAMLLQYDRVWFLAEDGSLTDIAYLVHHALVVRPAKAGGVVSVQTREGPTFTLREETAAFFLQEFFGTFPPKAEASGEQA